MDGTYIEDDRFLDRPTTPFETLEREFPPERFELFVAVGYARLNAVRAAKMAAAEAKGYGLASYLSSRAFAWDGFVVEPGVFILEDNTLQPFCRVGRGSVLWSGNHIGHHAKVGDCCFIASHAVLSGGVELGDQSFVGVNATIRDQVRLGARCVIGAGALVLADAPDEAVFAAKATERSTVPSSRLRRI